MLYSTSAIVAFASLAQAHMTLKTPTPFKPIAAVPSFNGPLNPDGSDFPCRNPTGQYTLAGERTKYPLGSGQKIAFIGSAVHGGGSCQVSISYDKNPTKASVWKVIHSIHGGCPARAAEGNLGGGAEADNPDKYDFKVPDNIPAGEVTVSITWFNKIGNREMYMYCSPVEITGTGGDKANFDKLPDMFLANIGNGCETLSSTDVIFPNPGQFVEELAAKPVLKAPSGKCGAAGAGGGAGTGNGSGSGSSSAAPSKATSSAGAGSPSSSLPGGVFMTVKPSSGAAAPTPSANPSMNPGNGNGGAAPSSQTTLSTTTKGSASTTQNAAAPTATTGNGSGSGSGSGSATGGKTGPCSTAGMFNCVGGTSFQQCASGMWSAVQPMAAGTKCKEGESATLFARGSIFGRRVRVVEN